MEGEKRGTLIDIEVSETREDGHLDPQGTLADGAVVLSCSLPERGEDDSDRLEVGKAALLLPGISRNPVSAVMHG